MSNELFDKLMKDARRKELKLIKRSYRELRFVYSDAARSLDTLSKRSYPGSMSDVWATEYTNELEKLSKEMHKILYSKNKEYIKLAAIYANEPHTVLYDTINDKYDLGIGDSMRELFARVPKEAINEIIGGQLYKDNKGLADRIYLDKYKMDTDMRYILARGIAEQKSSLDIAKDIQMYIDPAAKKDWSWKKVYPNAGKRVIDYNAQRLARTATNHAFFLSNIKSAERNPFVDIIHWELSNAHMERQVIPFGEDECDEYAAHDYGYGRGNFLIKDVPVPHPQCLCAQWPELAKSLDDIGTELRDWIHGQKNDRLDSWYNKTVKAKVDLDFVNLKGKTKAKKEEIKKPDKKVKSAEVNEFIPANTKKDAERWAVANLGIRNAKYSGIDLNVANNINKTILGLFEEFPELRGRIHNIKPTSSKRIYASAGIQSRASSTGARLETTLKISKHICGDEKYLQKVFLHEVDIGFHPKTLSHYNSVITHEIGHFIEYERLFNKHGYDLNDVIPVEDFNRIWRDLEKRVISTKIRDESLKELNFIKNDVVEEVSRYGKKNSAEFLAEAFAEAKEAKKPRELAKLVYKKMKALYGR
jgi:hypothetical protein